MPEFRRPPARLWQAVIISADLRDLLDGLPADAKARLRKRAQAKWVAPMLATLTDEVFSRHRAGYLSRNGMESAA
jgi:hypothetical protein